jgi:hypothetical protein
MTTSNAMHERQAGDELRRLRLENTVLLDHNRRFTDQNGALIEEVEKLRMRVADLERADDYNRKAIATLLKTLEGARQGKGGGDRPVAPSAPVDDAGLGGHTWARSKEAEELDRVVDLEAKVRKLKKLLNDQDTALIAYQYAIEKERERCARVIEGEGSFFVGESPQDRAAAAKQLANIIRSGK